MNKLTLSFVATFAYNTAIAGLLTAMGWMPQEGSSGFWCNFVFSQSIGFSIAIVSSLTLARMKPGRIRWATLGLVLPFSIAIGLTLGFELTGVGSWSHPYVWQSMLIALFFGVIASITFVLVERIGKLNEAIKERQLQVAEQDKRQLEAHLKLLQAQIEPHFLFNTLANVGSLINSDPTLAKKLLERLDDWLRVALARARSDSATLGHELEMLENYLQIMKIRFGERLSWQIDAENAARQVSFPPMLLQPLVENAVRHGIEPKLGGGAILIRADIAQRRLRIEVCDSGAGLLDGGNECGAGLANVRARLAALYGAAGKLMLDNNVAGGATAVLEIPQ